MPSDPSYLIAATEQWKPAPGFEGLYEVSDHGRVRKLYSRYFKALLDEPTEMQTPVKQNGYVNVGLRRPMGAKQSCSVAVLVLRAFKGDKPDALLQCAHLDGNKMNNRPQNLDWVTCKENNNHRHAHGTMPKGESSGNSKLTEREVLAIRWCNENGIGYDKIAKFYGIGKSSVARIVKRQVWTHI